MSVVALITDLFFVAKVKGTADAVGVPLEVVRTVDALVERAAGASLAIIDLNATGLDPLDAIRRSRALPQPPRILAYLSHVQKDLAAAAADAGADDVMPRSKFSADLPNILQDSK